MVRKRSLWATTEWSHAETADVYLQTMAHTGVGSHDLLRCRAESLKGVKTSVNFWADFLPCENLQFPRFARV